jgi:hypothetical protein
MNSSAGMAMAPWIRGLREMHEFTGAADNPWYAGGEGAPLQELFLTYLNHSGLRAQATQIPGLNSWADWDVDKVNQRLREAGLTIQLKDQHREDVFYMAAIDRTPLAWVCSGKTEDDEGEPYRMNGKVAYLLTANEETNPIEQFYNLGDLGWRRPVVVIPTTTPGLEVCIVAHEPLSGMGLWERAFQINEWIRQAPQQSGEGGDVLMPNVWMPNVTVDVSWLVGLWSSTPMGKLTLIEALMQGMFAAGPKGAVSVMGVAASGALEAAPRACRIDFPGIWFYRFNGLPSVVYYVGLDSHVDYIVDPDKLGSA